MRHNEPRRTHPPPATGDTSHSGQKGQLRNRRLKLPVDELQLLQPPEAGKRRSVGLGWRRKRSKHPVSRVPELFCAYDGKHTFGGTPLQPASGGDTSRLAQLGLPELNHFHDLARLLDLGVPDLFKLVVSTSAPHYLFHEIPKKSGGVRLLMAPLPRMKAAQRKLLNLLVSKVPLHHAAHGFRKGQDVLTNAGPHVGKPIVICMDITDFFPIFTFRRVSGYFRSLGYPRGVAVALANLTTWSPRGQFQDLQAGGDD
jgi:RNA-directed DNA polymerase